MENRLKAKYENEIRPALIEKFNYSSVMQAPKIDKIVLNMGVGDATTNSKNLDEAVEELGLISGQKPLITKAKKSIAGFRLREGMSIGAKVTLRGERMYDFLDKLVNVALPRVRDFHVNTRFLALPIALSSRKAMLLHSLVGPLTSICIPAESGESDAFDSTVSVIRGCPMKFQSTANENCSAAIAGPVMRRLPSLFLLTMGFL